MTRAIILAAGMGTRLRPLTSNTPKPLTKVNGKPIVERQIEFLHEKGIREITIVTGYLHEKFDYLKTKYGVNLVYNDKYADYNNIYSMYLVKDLLPNSYALEGDVFLNQNIFETAPEQSKYYCTLKAEFKNEWIVIMDENDKLTGIEENDGFNKYILSGISYWSKKDGEYIAEKLNEKIMSNNFSELFWDEIVKNNIENIDAFVKKLSPYISFEIDNVKDLREAENRLLENLTHK